MPPNIVVTVADDQRGSAIGCAGIEPVRTPHLDTLAKRGVRCDRAYYFGACHGAVCAPSRAMLHTGRPFQELDPMLMEPVHPPTGHALVLPPTLGQKLRAAGYHCYGTGKWHNGVDSFHASFDDGAAIFHGGMADHYFTPVHAFDPTGRYPDSAARDADGFSTEVFGQAAIDFIHSRRGKDEPFFLYCAFTAPHDPRTPPDAYRRRYDPRAIDLPPNVMPEHPFDNGECRGRDERLLGWPREPDEIRRSLAAYYAMISHMDEWIGRIHEALAEIGQDDNTIVVHTADHGLAVGQHGLLGKQNLYEHSVRVPLIVAGPGLPRGAERQGLCYQHDLHPTLLELAGESTEDAFFESLLPMLRGACSGRDHVSCTYRDIYHMVRDAQFKLIEYDGEGHRRYQLFDLANDPWELHDLSRDPGHAQVLAAMQRLSAVSRIGDPESARTSPDPVDTA